jgi:accessory colonization factor AcfC
VFESAKDDGMTITIGDEVIRYEDVYDDDETLGTAAIAKAMREAVLREIQRANTGKSQFASGDDKDTKLTYPDWKKQNPNGTSTEYKTYFNQ